MARHNEKTLRGERWRLALTAVAVFAAAYLLLSTASPRPTAASAEAKFADATASGLQVVPASGVSETSYTGAYTGTYTNSYTGTYTGTYTNSYTGTYTGSYTGSTGSYSPTTGSYTADVPPPGTCWDGSTPSSNGSCPSCPPGYSADSTGHCIPPLGPQFVGFTASDGFTASGHLQVRPSLVRSGDKSRVYWNVTNVKDCTVRGSNGDGAPGSATGAWNTLGSGTAGLQTSAITSRTDYTLFCHSLTGATPSTITETRTVNVIPSWYEPSGN